jgi:hypothetical protein
MDETLFILSSWVSTSSALTYRTRQSLWPALHIKGAKQPVSHFLAAPASTLVISAPFSRAVPDRRSTPFFSNRVLHLLNHANFCRAIYESIGCLEQGAHFCVSARSPDDFDAGLMEWVPGAEQAQARYKDPARDGHAIAFVIRERLLQAVGDDLGGAHVVSATEPERVRTSETHLLVMLGRKTRRSASAVDCSASERPAK